MAAISIGSQVSWKGRQLGQAVTQSGTVYAIGSDYAEVWDQWGAEWCVMLADLAA